jgi:hypothetical protein
MVFDEPFDAIIGRYVLVFQKDYSETLKRLAGHVRPGGLIIFHEGDFENIKSFPPSPTYDTCWRWITETSRLHGLDAQAGMKLYSAFVSAGLPAPTMRLEAVIGGGENSLDCLRLASDLISILLPEILRFGIATEAEVDAETLIERMHKEVVANSSVVVARREIGAWCRV